jgi:hypothetical protein
MGYLILEWVNQDSKIRTLISTIMGIYEFLYSHEISKIDTKHRRKFKFSALEHIICYFNLF